MYNKLTYNPISLQQIVTRLFVAFIFGLVWCLPLITLAANLEGVLYTDAGITAGTSGKTIKVAVGASATVYSTTTTSGGVWIFTAIDFTNVSTTTPITVWLDGDADDATTLVAGYSGSNITGTPLYYGHVVTYGASTTAEVQMENFNYSSSADSDILYLNQHRFFDIASNTNFIIKQGVAVSPKVLNIYGNLQIDGVFNGLGETLSLKGVGKTISGSFANDSSFGDVVVTGTYTLTTLSNVAAENFSIRNTGIFTNNGTLAVSGSFNNLGVFEGAAGSLYVEGNGQIPLIYKAGRDASGNSTGTVGVTTNSAIVTGNYLYTGKVGNATACSQTAGSAAGCELMVFDISSSTNPVYVAGRDVSGNSTGTGSSEIRSIVINGNYLYVGSIGNSTACSQIAGSAIGCEIQVYDISSSTNPVYVAGMDGSGIATGTDGTTGSIYSLTTNGNYLFAGKNASSFACSQNPGSAQGCELQVYDISSSTNMIYIAGRDTSGSATGTGGSSGVNYITSLSIMGNYLYVGKDGSTTACSQTAGSAIGCELMIFDISSSTNPVYVAGRDVTGNSTGSTDLAITSLTITGNYLYVGKHYSTTACSQTAGSAAGCELMVFDISSSTNPVYVAGRDASGSAAGTGGSYIFSLTTSNNYLYVGKELSSTACSQTAGSAIGCELMVFDEIRSFSAGEVSGNLSGTSTLGNLYTSGTVQLMADTASTSALIVNNGTFTASSDLTIGGDYYNGGVADFSNATNVYFESDYIQTITGVLSGTSSLPNTFFLGGAVKTLPATVSVKNLTIDNGVTVEAGTYLEAKGDYTNNGILTNIDSEFELNSGFQNYSLGLDASGNSTGTTAFSINASAVAGNYLYVGKGSDATACSQTAGSAVGCEIMVFDVSSSTNPIYVAGRDASGSEAGTGAVAIYSMTISGNYLYVGKISNATACSQIAGSAQGCELMVFDVSSSTNPIYVAGRDESGSESGTGSQVIYTMTVSGNYLYAGKGPDATACSQIAGSAQGCELMVFDVSSSTNPIYVAGRDASGSATGTGSEAVSSLAYSGDYLFLSKYNDATACGQTAGSAIGCELMVFDISSSTDPTYIVGRDVSGGSAGTGNVAIYNIAIAGNYLYTGKAGNTTACSQLGTGATGCELAIFNISNPTNPTYVAGRDASGNAAGTLSVSVNYVATAGSYLYIGKAGNATACSQTAGSAEGCELMVFDISSSTNPTYFSGRDAVGSVDGMASINILTLSSAVDDLFVGSAGSAAACSQVVGSAGGCELKVYPITADVRGSLVDDSAFSDLVVRGAGALFHNNASTTNFTIESGTVTAPAKLSVASRFENAGVFNANDGEVILTGSENTVLGTTTFFNLRKNPTESATTTFGAGSTYTISNHWDFTGSSTYKHYLVSTSSGQYWYVDPQGTVNLTDLNVKDSNNINVSAVTCGLGCIDGGNNVNWSISSLGSVSLSSASDYHFYAGAATTTLPDINLVDSVTPAITATNDIRISIATTTTNFRFDTTNTTLSFAGSASGKVSSTVSYEDVGATLLINVTSDFATEDTLVIAGIEVGSFAAATAATSSLALYVGGDVDGTPDAEDDKTIHLTGSLLLDEHTLDQVDNEFSFQNKTDEALFAFNLTGVGEVMTVTDTVVTLSGVQGVDDSKLSGFRLYRDVNSDRILDGGDIQLDATGILTINGQHGAITFSDDFVATTSADYIVVGSTNGIQVGDSVVFSLGSTGLTVTGDISSYLPYIVNTLSTIQHTRGNSGGSGSKAVRIGGAPPEGDGDVGGGNSGGGEGAGEEEEGANIADNPNYIKPSATGDIHNEWTNGANAYDSDGVYATAASSNLRQTYNGFAFGIPGSNTIQGIDVKIDTSGTTAAGTIDVAISWDGGSSFTSAKATPTLTDTDVVYTVGGPADTWGRAWSASEFSTENFRLRVTAQTSANTLRLDALQIRVYHQAGGGGSGGGGGI